MRAKGRRFFEQEHQIFLRNIVLLVLVIAYTVPNFVFALVQQHVQHPCDTHLCFTFFIKTVEQNQKPKEGTSQLRH